MPRVKTGTIGMSFFAPVELYNRAIAYAAREELTRAALLKLALTDYLDERAPLPEPEPRRTRRRGRRET